MTFSSLYSKLDYKGQRPTRNDSTRNDIHLHKADIGEEHNKDKQHIVVLPQPGLQYSYIRPTTLPYDPHFILVNNTKRSLPFHCTYKDIFSLLLSLVEVLNTSLEGVYCFEMC